MYKHVIIDEGQDFSPMMLQSLANAIPEDGSITFFGDVAQQIYGGRISWRDAGLKVKPENIWRFEQNYRNSKEIAELAISISEQPFFKDDTNAAFRRGACISGGIDAFKGMFAWSITGNRTYDRTNSMFHAAPLMIRQKS